jgi:CBS domain-containing protein
MANQNPPHADYPLFRPVKQLIKVAPVFVAPDASIGETARAMQRARVGSALVASEPPGIVTDRDLRGRVLAANLGPETAVIGVMSRPLKTIDAGAPAFAALRLMIDENVHHVPVVEEEKIIGVVSATDLLVDQTNNPIYLRGIIGEMDEPGAIGNYASRIAALAEALFRGGLGALQIGQVVSGLNDALAKRFVQLAELDFGKPPVSYAWMVFGSEGRMEQTLLTDQDNALVYEDGSLEADAYFREFARRVVNGLIRAGLPPCTGGFMATGWRKPLGDWQQLFTSWLRVPDPQALLDASIFFDYRSVAGALSLEPLDEVIGAAAGEKLFLAHMLKGALQFQPPLGIFNRLRTENGAIDLKKTAIMPIVGMARVAALAAGSRRRSTLDRLTVAAESGAVLTGDTARALAEIFPFLLRLRLEAQLAARSAGEPLNHRIAPARLSAFEWRQLKEAFVLIKRTQEELRALWHLDRLG